MSHHAVVEVPLPPLFHSAAQRVDRAVEHLARVDAEMREIEAQYLSAVALEYHAGRLTWWELLACHRRLHPLGVPGFKSRWVAAIGLDQHQIVRNARAKAETKDGVWRGDTGWPIPFETPCPPRGTFVVYALYNSDGSPRYIGSTSMFRIRTNNHHRDGKTWHSWSAEPCATRKEAYHLETTYIRMYKPTLNKRAA